MKSDQYKQLVWDYNLSKKEFGDILTGKKTIGSLDQSWAISRVLENLNYYDAMNLVTLDQLKSNWSNVKSKLFKNYIKNGYEFLLQRYAVPVAE